MNLGRTLHLWGALALTLVLPRALSAQQFYNDWAATNFAGLPAQSGPTNNPDGDGEANLMEYVLGTNPRVAGDFSDTVTPVSASSNGTLVVEVLERAGRRPGVQLDIRPTNNLTNWFRPWWLRGTNALHAGDPAGAVRETFTTALPGTNRWYARVTAQLIEAGAEAAKYYVATNGSDSNKGTNLALPFATLGKAAGLANAGDLIYVRGGTYPFTNKLSLSRSGTAALPIRLRPYPGERVLLDFSGEATGTDGISISGNSWWLTDLAITNAGHNGINLSGASNVVERCVVRNCRNTGIHITGTLNTKFNLILNCDSYRNYDADTHGQNADGYSAKWVFGPGNVFSGCRAWENADDGWDLWMGTNTIIITNCWAFRQGTNIFGDLAWQGNGNGFKLGGNYIGTPHTLVRSMAFANMVNGVDQNNNLAGQTIDQNTCWGNRGANYSLNHGTNTTPHIIRNNISFGANSGDSFRTGSLRTNNSWQVYTSPAVATTDVLSLDYSLAAGPRRDDGGLPELPFLRPVPGGRLVDKGITNGAPYSGTAPDLGAAETSPW